MFHAYSPYQALSKQLPDNLAAALGTGSTGLYEDWKGKVRKLWVKLGSEALTSPLPRHTGCLIANSGSEVKQKQCCPCPCPEA